MSESDCYCDACNPSQKAQKAPNLAEIPLEMLENELKTRKNNEKLKSTVLLEDALQVALGLVTHEDSCGKVAGGCSFCWLKRLKDQRNWNFK